MSLSAKTPSTELLNGFACLRHHIRGTAAPAVDGARMEDRTDWRRWMAEHGPTLLLLAKQWVGSADEAQDVVQEAFVRFWRSRHRAADPAAYLYACTRQYCRQWQRQRLRQRRRDTLAARPEQSDATDLFVAIEQDE